ncbi:Hypothetical_protein [Hexamita inflata]|uniref:Hypothetical_protein n=1 Tax=Hexamita inflata TaxID=28002 RepID=A0AA86QQ08_9EUKA|nr:Hypothetical protein HINF_LOCUS43495 [Hexamita inflata]
MIIQTALTMICCIIYSVTAYRFQRFSIQLLRSNNIVEFRPQIYSVVVRSVLFPQLINLIWILVLNDVFDEKVYFTVIFVVIGDLLIALITLVIALCVTKQVNP